MMLQLTETELELLDDLLEVTYKGKLRELHHTATMAYKRDLKGDIETIEGLRAKLAGVHASGVPG